MPDDQQPSAATPEPTEAESAVEAVLEPAPEPAQDITQAPTPPPAPYAVVEPEPGYTTSGVPTFDSVREKIENRYGTALGAVELAEETPEGRTVSEQYDARQRAAAERLKQIRESMSDKDQD